MHLVKVVFLGNDVKDLWRILAVVSWVPLANVLNPERSTVIPCNIRHHHHHHLHHHHHHHHKMLT